MDAQIIAIIIAIVGTGLGTVATLTAVFMPPLIMLIRDQRRTNATVVALCNHRHSAAGETTFALPAN